MTKYHTPVLLDECLEGLEIKKEGIYIDVTYGAGGHSKPILKQLNAKGHLYSFDKDEDVRRNLVEADNFTFIHSDFRFIGRFLDYYGLTHVNGVLADLGVSSFQFDTRERGFGYMVGGDLDMRMNQGSGLTAADILNTYQQSQLLFIFSKYGEVRNSKTLSNRIIERRRTKSFTDIQDFIAFLSGVSMGNQSRYLAQVFQALRIEVNDEMASLEKMLTDVSESLTSGGRLVVMSYHSLEDRIVKKFMKSGNVRGERTQDDYGKSTSPFKVINKKVIMADKSEQSRNPRSRSAKLRIAEKI